jgi:hypothetical protein
MALADWPPRRIALLWFIVLTIDACLVLLARAREHGLQHQTDIRFRFDTVPGSRGAPLGPDSQAVLMYALFEASAATRNAPPDTGRLQLLSAILAESSTTRRDSLWTASGLPARVTSEQRDSAKAVVEAVVGPVLKGLDLLANVALVAALILWGALAVPPLAAATITVAWWLGRRRANTAA